MAALPRWLWGAIGVAGLLLVGWGYLHFVHDPYVRRVAGLKASNDSLNKALIQHVAEDSKRAHTDTVIVRQNAAVRLRVDTLMREVAVKETLFVARLPDSLKSGFDSIIVDKDSIIAGKDRIIVGDSQRLVLRDASLTDCQSGLAEALKQRDAAIRLARPSFIVRLFRDLPKYAVGAAVGAAATVVLVGTRR